LGFKKVFSFDETIKTFPEYLTLLWEKFYSYRQVPVDKNTQKELKNLFEDEKSLEILERIFRFREKPAYENYPLPERDFQYFPEFIRNFFKERTIHFADLGAYKGDTVAILLYLFENKVNGNLKRCFKRNFTKRIDNLPLPFGGLEGNGNKKG
jgi:hypothetical protein